MYPTWIEDFRNNRVWLAPRVNIESGIGRLDGMLRCEDMDEFGSDLDEDEEEVITYETFGPLLTLLPRPLSYFKEWSFSQEIGNSTPYLDQVEETVETETD